MEALRQHEKDAHAALRRIGAFAAGKRFVHEENSLVYERLARMPFTHGNHVELLIDGEATFNAILDAVDRAEHYILLEFFIVHDDELGRDLKARLLRRAAEGLHICFLYDEVGSNKLPKAYREELRQAGIRIVPFKTTRGWKNKFQLNFRNHRKITIIDGREAYVGGLNVGDEYMGRDPKFGHWRDTHVKLTGPAVQAVQLDWTADWLWSTRDLPDLNWEPAAAPGCDQKVLALATGPADTFENCSLFFVNTINSATERVWLTSPYFVPDEAVTKALQLAALRGVDVRIMLPEKPDHILVYLAAFGYLPVEDCPNLNFYRYTDGFLHQKVVLIDRHMVSVGTANLDNRSFRLNFEISILVHDEQFATAAEQMLEHDFAHCRRVRAEDYHRRSFLFKCIVKIAGMFSPIL
jgi:cardiolipin synthase